MHSPLSRAFTFSLCILSSHALIRDLMALPQITSVPALREWCVTVAVSKNAAVLGNYTIGQGDGITTNVMVTDDWDHSPLSGKPLHNKLDQKGGPHKFKFITHRDSLIRTCFTNVLAEGLTPSPSYVRRIEFGMTTGSEAKIETPQIDIEPHLAQLTMMEEDLNALVAESEHLKHREEGMRNTNESTHSRVRFWGIFSLLVIIGCGALSMMYLSRYFKTKKLI